jgi:hypothetical protein
VEHFKRSLLDHFNAAWICAFCLFILTSCKQPEEHPELLDPIYSDLSAQAAGFQGKAEGQKKKIEELTVKIEKYGARDPEAKQTIFQKENLERGLQQLEQQAQYYTIRANQRRLFDKESYTRAFNADQPWPPADEFKEYQESKKLVNASRDWSKTVPIDRSHNRPAEDKKKKKEEKKAE